MTRRNKRPVWVAPGAIADRRDNDSGRLNIANGSPVLKEVGEPRRTIPPITKSTGRPGRSAESGGYASSPSASPVVRPPYPIDPWSEAKQALEGRHRGIHPSIMAHF
jgi:hypothetical protein